jgi:hypothetical protein
VEKEGSSSSGMGVERSEALASSPNQRAHGESREGNGGRLGAARRKENGREGGQAWHGNVDCEAGSGGGLANNRGRWGASDTARRG